jgi:hypothetical protein
MRPVLAAALSQSKRPFACRPEAAGPLACERLTIKEGLEWPRKGKC